MNEIEYWRDVAAAFGALLPLLAIVVAVYLVLRVLWLVSKVLLVLAVVVLIMVVVVGALN